MRINRIGDCVWSRSANSITAESPSPSLSPFDDSTAAKTWGYIVFEWLAKHMDINFVAHAYPRLIRPMKNQPPPLHFKSTAVILGRNYTLELQKAPFFYWMQEFTVTSLHTENPPSSVPTIVNVKVVSHTGGFYRVVSEVSADYEYLVRVHISRC